MATLHLETGRITCEVCEETIGQGSAETTGAVGFLEVNHFAPCGLPCACEGADRTFLNEHSKPGKLPDGTITGVHKSDAMCPRCCYQPCPVCRQTGDNVVVQGYTQHGSGVFGPCKRCHGRGTVPGRELWEGV